MRKAFSSVVSLIMVLVTIFQGFDPQVISYYHLGIGRQIDCGDIVVANASERHVYINGKYYLQSGLMPVKYVLEEGNVIVARHVGGEIAVGVQKDCKFAKFNGRPGLKSTKGNSGASPVSLALAPGNKTTNFTLRIGSSLHCEGLSITNKNGKQVVFNGTVMNFPRGDQFDFTAGEMSVVFFRAWIFGDIRGSTNAVCNIVKSV